MPEPAPFVGLLIGRDAELAEIGERLRSRRLVTLVGPGGVGKTATAREAAHRAADRFPLGVRFVDLTRTDNPDAVAGTFAAQLGCSSLDALLASADQPLLVIADNCEHLLDAAVATINALLDGSDQITVLATSRSPLDVERESVVALAPLPVPDAGDPAPLDAPGVRLFLTRARDAGVTIGPDEYEGVVELCRRLDGLPLALEIAAARTRSLNVADLLRRLDQGVAVLQRARFRGSRRHRSVAELVQWSIELLTAEETELLERLALLSGPFRAADLRRLVAPPDDDSDTESVLESLVLASLVTVDRDAERVRYRLLATVRACLLERLRERGLLDARFAHFAERVISRVWERLAEAGSRWDPDLMRDVSSQFDDMAAALRWCLDRDDDPRRAVSLGAALFALVQQGRAHEIHALASQVFTRWPDALDRGVPHAAQAWGTWATAENLVGNPGRAIELAERGLATAARSSWAAVTWHRAIGQSRVALRDRPAAARAFATGAALGRQLGLTAMALELELANAQIAADSGDIDTALAVMAAASAEARGIGSAVNAVWADTLAAWTTVRRDPGAGLARARATLDEARAVDYPNACAGNLRTIAFAHLRRGALGDAADAVADLWQELRRRGSLSNARMVVDVAAVLAYRTGHPAWASLTATAACLAPATMLSSPGFDLEPLPASAETPRPLRAALAMVGQLLADLRAGRTESSGSESRTNGDAEPGAEAVAPGAAAMRRLGDVWEITFAGRSVSVRTGKGLADLAVLLAEPGREVHCLDLIGAVATESSTGELIDAVARRQYEQRLRDLQADIEDAETAHDLRRAENARAEFDALVEHLSASLGIGGRARHTGSSAERARSTVTQRLRSVLRHLADVHPELGRHLRNAVHTGMWCSYTPEHPTPWSIDASPAPARRK
jgi:predicted ATPase